MVSSSYDFHYQEIFGVKIWVRRLHSDDRQRFSGALTHSKTTFSIMALSIATFSIRALSETANIIMTLSITNKKCDIQHKDTQNNAEHCYAECQFCSLSFMLSCHKQALYEKCHYAECRYAEYRVQIFPYKISHFNFSNTSRPVTCTIKVLRS